jgi:putative endonuclease
MALSEERVERLKRLKKEKNMPAWIYILRLKSGQLYIRSTTDLDQRYKDHCSGKACRTTQLDPPQKLLYSEELHSFSDARKREAQVKRWSRAKKEALVSDELTKLKRLSKSHQKVKSRK